MSKFLVGNIKGPKGDKGEPGATGPKGEQGIQGPVGPAGGVNSVNGKKGDVNIADALGYTPAGGENLVPGSNVPTEITAQDTVRYAFRTFVLAKTLVKNETYTVSFDVEILKGNLSAISVSIQNKEIDEAQSNVVNANIIDGKVIATLDITGDSSYYLLIYAGTFGSTQGNSIRVSKIMLQEGTVPNPVWTPAPQDVLLKGEVDGRNLFILKDCVPGWLNESGLQQEDKKYNTISSDFISVISGETYTAQYWVTVNKADGNDYSWARYVFYNGEKTYIDRITFANQENNAKYNCRTFTIPENCSYIRVSARMYNDGRIKVERGNVATDWTPAPEDVVTKTPYDIFTALDGIPEMHRNLYRGRNLGESMQMSAEHKAAIQNGSFKDLFVGDYWTHDGINYRIADADYFYNCGDMAFKTHHLVIVPDTCLGTNKQMNPTSTTAKGYKGSDMRENTLPTIKTEFIDKAFPDLVLSHREYLTTEIADGYPSKGEWVDSDVELMNEIMVYGCPVFTPANTGATVPALYTIDNSQLALFQLNPRMIKTRYNYWLRDVVSASNFAYVDANSPASTTSASSTYIGVRPVFCIGVAPAADEADDDMEVVGAVESTERMEADEMGDGADTGAETDATKTHDEIESDANEKDMEDV